MSRGGRVLVIDNRDSFVFNLADELLRRGADVVTVRNGIALAALDQRIADFAPDLIVLSPGPGHPEAAGVMVPFLRTRPALPILGVCLGHQAMAVACGGEVGPAPRPRHGRSSIVDRADDPAFAGLPRSFAAARYHSLVVTRVPDELAVVATTREPDATLVMAVRHRRLPWLGLQFHPESILTPLGGAILGNVLDAAQARRANGDPHTVTS